MVLNTKKVHTDYLVRIADNLPPSPCSSSLRYAAHALADNDDVRFVREALQASLRLLDSIPLPQPEKETLAVYIGDVLREVSAV